MRRGFNIVMRVVSSLIGLAMIWFGCIWIMQGMNVGPAWVLQGFMVNDKRWAVYGLILVLLGIGQLVWSNTRQRA